ncbi:helix-turn-helix transcriptional regulator [Geotalea sp. SG265]|uniref:helix-turn-helix domain-containing protein n=1 Tax=Geotalea sp. SG265 TaxID=2922867 RepID=UPI001FAEB9EE|nr:helix-turn-helix transcriptional regulator [Geotalea sp. SG265]
MSHQRIMSSTEIGAAIRRRRQELALSQEDLAARLDVSYQQIQRYESGKNRLNVENIQVIASALSVPVNYFFHTKHGDNRPHVESQPNPKEQELLVQFRKIQDDHLKELVVNLSRLAAKEGEDA